MTDKVVQGARFLYIPDDGKAQVNGLHPEEIYGLLNEMKRMHWMGEFKTNNAGMKIEVGGIDLTDVPCLMAFVGENNQVEMIANKMPSWRITYHIENAMLFWRKFITARTNPSDQPKIILPGMMGLGKQ